jgi:hypothetical protein
MGVKWDHHMNEHPRNSPDYVVIRPAADLPSGSLPQDLDGKWFDRSQLQESRLFGEAVAVPSGRFEVRDDGAVAEVYEVRP